ncbi:zinc finger A20 and AN1 domain-containing stress-associated protein 4-like [Alnus glutinosa]|uniref:zinc finger A20 and AN1 domain-containing stress-associated protein 4-like n=1 Tax=Alnus glutinosa TaxID=3517 RepID=UPI002D774F62|nr:zinc finger A20 and AN1 domain-containing stress-associated protein 4-like [Alnus glutinosa]
MAEEHRCEAPEGHRLCANNCSFFGSTTTMNLCSKCYGELHHSSSKSSMEIALSSSSTSSPPAIVSLPPPPPPPALTLPEVAKDVRGSKPTGIPAYPQGSPPHNPAPSPPAPCGCRG